MQLYTPKTKLISFTHTSGKVTQLTATAEQKYATVMITSVHKGTIMTATKVFFYHFVLLI